MDRPERPTRPGAKPDARPDTPDSKPEINGLVDTDDTTINVDTPDITDAVNGHIDEDGIDGRINGIVRDGWGTAISTTPDGNVRVRQGALDAVIPAVMLSGFVRRTADAEQRGHPPHSEDPSAQPEPPPHPGEDDPPPAQPEPGFPRPVPIDKLALSRDIFWTIEDLLPRTSQMMIYGRGGGGKTYLASSIAIGIASGRWFDYPAEKGAVLVGAFERPDDAEDRLAALRDRLRLAGLAIELLKLPGYGLDDSLAQHMVECGKALAASTGVPLRAIIIDTVSAALAGSKEDDEGLGRLRAIGERIAADTGAMVVWLHHEGKADHNGPRGHLVLAEACGVWWWIEEREDGSRVVHVVKANRGPSYQPLFAFRLVPFVAGQDQRGKDIALCELELVDLDGSMASKPKLRFGTNGSAAGTSGGGKLQKIMAKELGKLAKNHPDGVGKALLKSAFICELVAAERASGDKVPDKDTLNRKFRQTLAGMIQVDRIEDLGGDLLLPAGDSS